jgi:hypothetical protein
MDFQAYERQRNALHLLKILAQGDQAYLQGRHVSHTEARQHFRVKLESLRSHA